MARSTDNTLGLKIGCQYQNQERKLVAYIDVDCDTDAELIRYTLVVMPAEFVDHGTYTAVTITFGDLPLYTYTVLQKGKRCTAKRNFEAEGVLQSALRRWLYDNN